MTRTRTKVRATVKIDPVHFLTVDLGFGGKTGGKTKENE
jgi:hypothetical protein